MCVFLYSRPVFSEPPLDGACSCIQSVPNLRDSTGSSSSVTSECLLAVGTKRGEVAIVDIRRPAVVSHFTAHDGAVRSILLDKATDSMTTAGADGIVKVIWSDFFSSSLPLVQVVGIQNLSSLDASSSFVFLPLRVLLNKGPLAGFLTSQ